MGHLYAKETLVNLVQCL